MADPLSSQAVTVSPIGRFVRRVASGMSAMWQTAFGPGTPLSPRQPEGEPPRQWDYIPGYNIAYIPRTFELYSFDMLRQLSRNFDLLRTIINARIDQIKGLEWDIVLSDENDTADYSDDIKIVSKFFEKPDRMHDFDVWLGMVAEDQLVIDALTIFKRRTRNGSLYALEPVDGATIKVLIDEYGRVPEPPEPAYLQIIKGTPWVKLSREDLIYKPERKRTDSAYGFSRVEGIMLRINLALRKEMWELQYFTEGNIPEAFGKLPESWTAEQIKQFQDYWDAFFENNTANRRKMKWLPGGTGTGVEKIQQEMFPIEFDEYIARVVCAAFGVSPIPFVRMMNRATAAIQAMSQTDTAFEPMKQFYQSIFTNVIQQDLGFPWLKFAWVSEGRESELEKAQIEQIYVATGIKTKNEVRADLGLDPLPEPEPEPALVGGMQPPGGNGSSQDNNAQETMAASEMKLWRSKVMRAMKNGRPATVIFSSSCIPSDVQKAISDMLSNVSDSEDVRDVFEEGLILLKAKPKPDIRGRLAAQRKIQQAVHVTFRNEATRLAELAVKRVYP